MKLVSTIQELKTLLASARQEGKKIGLVPTMGALHRGHASLVERCVAENDLSVVSVFLNPTQFNDKVDLEKYPRTLEADCALMEEVGASIVFAPSVSEMYPEEDLRRFSYPGVDSVADLKLPVEIIPCPVIREESGLAMSSRNTLLSDEERQTAAQIYQVLKKSKLFAANHSLADTRSYVIDTINSVVGLEVQYFSIVDGDTLQDLDRWDESDSIVGCITVFCGAAPIRLIDHIRYKG